MPRTMVASTAEAGLGFFEQASRAVSTDPEKPENGAYFEHGPSELSKKRCAKPLRILPRFRIGLTLATTAAASGSKRHAIWGRRLSLGVILHKASFITARASVHA